MNVYESCDQNREGAEVTQVRFKVHQCAGLSPVFVGALLCCPVCVLLVLISQKQQKQRVGGSGREVRVTQ